jgi:hypothetical protein
LADQQTRGDDVHLEPIEERSGDAAWEACDQRSAVKHACRRSGRVDRARVTEAIQLPTFGLFLLDATRV